MTSGLTLHYDKSSFRHEMSTVSRHHYNDDDDPVDNTGRNDVNKRRAHQRSSKHKHKHPLAHKQIEVGNSVKTREFSDDEEADDSGSVCSGVSSASGSSGGTSHKRNGRKSRCPVHSHRRRHDVELSINDMSEKLSVCCCRSTNKKAITVARPEPEGGTQSSLFKTAMDEFERLIYGPNEPLFSDCEGTTDDAVELVELRTSNDKPRKCHGVSDAPDVTEGLFTAAQMINTNTFMKFAIIQNELKNIRAVSLRRAENEVSSLCRRADVGKENCEQSEHSLQTVSQLLTETVAEFQRRTCSSQTDESLSQHLQQCCKHRKQTSASQSDAVRRHVTSGGVFHRLVITDIDTEMAANNLDAAEQKVIELEQELKTLVGTMNGSTSEKKEKAIRDVTWRLKEAEHRAMLAEQEVLVSKREAATNKDELLASLKKNQPVGSANSSFTLADLILC